jgi:ATP-dependent exoDNAse (exonuclease V) beta subunit
MKFPTNKPHISYSELKIWKECPWKHKLMYVDGIQTYENNPYAEFGTIIHDTIENYLKTGAMDVSKVEDKLKDSWAKHQFDSQEYIDKLVKQRKKFDLKYRHEKFESWLTSAYNILSSIPDFMEETFGEWEYVSAEEELYEYMEEHDLSFKGFIDAIIKSKKNGKEKYWVIDWKTTGPRGWYKDKMRDFLTHAQVGLYKKFWAERENIPLKSIGCGYALLKRNTKPERCAWFMNISVGPKFITKSEKLIESMVKSVKNGMNLKNRNNCRFCSFYQTENCT